MKKLLIIGGTGGLYDNFVLKYKGNYEGGILSHHNFQA
jgi:hypothetical protein